MNDVPAADKTRADICLLAVTEIYCVGASVGIVLAGHGAFGLLSLEVGGLIACSGLVIGVGVLAVSLARRIFSASIALASITIWCVSLWACYQVLQGYANV
jgi:hypothetical protein